jgi:tetratricopeptide (TPR) repeat protein
VADDRRREQRPRPRTAEPPRGQRANRGPAHPDKPAGRAGRGEHPRAAAREAPRPGLARKPDEPPVPEDVDTRALHRSVRAELRGLPKELGDIVAAHLLVAGQLIDDDPELAYAHAEAARRRAARLPIVREAAAETAYAAGRYDVALSEFRALRRMTGVDDYLPVMADCERALGRPDAALKLAKQARSLTLDPSLRAEMVMVEAGARSDLGQVAEALRILRAGISASDRPGFPRQAAARLRFAYADALARNGSAELSREWFAAAAKLDPEQETDAQARLDELDGLVLELDETDLDGSDDQAAGGPAGAEQSPPVGPAAGRP